MLKFGPGTGTVINYGSGTGNRPYFSKVGIGTVKNSYGSTTLVLVPPKKKRYILVTEFFTMSDPMWVGDMRTEPKNRFL